MEDYDSYFKYAKLLTDVHAKPKISSNKMEIEKNTVSKKDCFKITYVNSFFFLFPQTPIKIQKEAEDS